uniref:F5/8 type C domain-containing protein n=1 Tax=Cyprinus carpio TaxID=7962 RepID=A0A8C2CGN6_CYPCA
MANGQEENAALLGKSNQSSNYNSVSGSQLALDELINTWTQTNEEANPWWRVDLLKVYRVNRVTITNSLINASRINGTVIRIGNFLDIYKNTICAVISTLAGGAMATFSCCGMEGRYMVVHIPGDQKILSLSEIGVYGYLAGNLAVDGAATQSSTFPGWFAEKAIDSNRGLQQLNTGCSSTLNETNPWWRLDLRKVYRISEVVITYRQNCCTELINGTEIRIGNSLENNGNKNPICAVIPAIPAGESYRYLCSGMDGRYVNLIIPGDMKTLTLCEVEVYGEGETMSHIFSKQNSDEENVLKQLGSALADRGFTNVTLRWSQTPKRVIQKLNAG